MDVEAIPIQVQTPPKEDEPEPAPEHSSETMDSIEVPARRDIENGLKNDEWDDDADGEGDNDRHDEIIVGSKENSIDDEEERGAESPLSSAPDSGDEDEVAKSRTFARFHFRFMLLTCKISPLRDHQNQSRRS